jgi:hypothetical protein
MGMGDQKAVRHLYYDFFSRFIVLQIILRSWPRWGRLEGLADLQVLGRCDLFIFLLGRCLLFINPTRKPHGFQAWG